MKVMDINGVEAESLLLEGPTILGLEEGDRCVDAGYYAVYYPDRKPLALSPIQFTAQFVEVQ